MKVISMNPEAMAALQSAEGSVAKKKSTLRLPRESLARIHTDIAWVMFGEAMQPTFRARLLMYSSFAAIKHHWAADNWQRKQSWRVVA